MRASNPAAEGGSVAGRQVFAHYLNSSEQQVQFVNMFPRLAQSMKAIRFRNNNYVTPSVLSSVLVSIEIIALRPQSLAGSKCTKAIVLLAITRNNPSGIEINRFIRIVFEALTEVAMRRAVLGYDAV
jgi:hypothetical protein